MNIIFIVSTKILVLLSLLSCGKDSGESTSSEVPARAPRYRALLEAQDETIGTAVLKESEEELETEVHVVTNTLRRNLDRALIIKGPCPADGAEAPAESVLYDLGNDKGFRIKFGATPPPLGGHSALLASQEGTLACGPLIPIPQE